MSTKFLTIKTLTNLHVGSGDNDYGVVDNQVQKDVNTNLPTIHASSLKGALREFFEHTNNGIVTSIFGDKDNAGSWFFLSADLISRPLRSNKISYVNATSPQVLQRLILKIKEFGLTPNSDIIALSKLNIAKGAPLVFEKGLDGAVLEELDWEATYYDLEIGIDVKNILGAHIALVNDSDFQALDLPVIARNYLENGESKNLWYEEVVPYDTRFGFFILAKDNWDDFIKGIEKPVQIGANASVGYGLCKLEVR